MNSPLGYANYPTQKLSIWASVQISRKRFCKLQEAIWLTVINEIFKLPPHFNPLGYINYLYELSFRLPKLPNLKMIHLGRVFRLLERDFVNYIGSHIS